MTFIPVPPFWLPDSIIPKIPSLEGILIRAQTAAGGAVLAGSGLIGLAVIPPRIENKNLKILTQITGAGMFVYGIIQVAKAVGPTEPIKPPEPATPEEDYPMYVSHPTGNDKVYCIRDFNFGTVVTNNYNARKQVYVGMTLRKVGGELYDYTAQPVVLEPRSSKEILWKGQIGCWGPENWEIRFSTWDKPPAPGATRIGDTGWFPFTTAGFV